jgi:hypothetical protein
MLLKMPVRFVAITSKSERTNPKKTVPVEDACSAIEHSQRPKKEYPTGCIFNGFSKPFHSITTIPLQGDH